MIRIAIAEDSEEELKKLLRYLTRYQEENQCTFDIEIYRDGAQIVTAYRPGTDILMLDIEMPLMDGMRTARILRERDGNVAIVFVTNLAQYAIQGYEVEAMDFIVKPLDWNVFAFRMTRILSRLKRQQETTAHGVVVRTDHGLRRVEIPDLRYVEVYHHTLTYHTVDGQYSERNTMNAVEKALQPYGFCRCNQCYLVNLRFVTALEDEIVTVGGEQLRISRSKKKELIRALSEYMINT